MNLGNCKIVNTVWIERGILLMIIYIILKKYNNIKKKDIIINDTRLRNFLQNIFPKLKFYDNTIKSKKKFYFNIRNLVKKQDIIIDYLNNYEDDIPTDKIWLVPYYDLNDPLILYQYDKNKKMDAEEQRTIIRNFSGCNRSNYNGNSIIWDKVFEKTILDKADTYQLHSLIKKINNYLQTNYTDTVQIKPVITYLPSFSPTLKENLKSFQKSPTILKLSSKFNNLLDKVNTVDKTDKILEKMVKEDKSNHSQKSSDFSSEEVEELIDIFDDKIQFINRILN